MDLTFLVLAHPGYPGKTPLVGCLSFLGLKFDGDISGIEGDVQR